MQVLKQSTTATILVGPVLDADGAAYTSAVIGDFNITKNGSTAALAAAATATHSHNGMYLIQLTTGNTDTLGRLDVSMNNTSYGMTNHRYEVLTANQFDALVTNGSVTPAAIADAVWDEPYSQHTTAGTFGKLMDILRKANLTIDGTVSNAITPTTLTFSSNVSATTSAYAHAVLLFVSGPLTGENSPIISYDNTNGVFVLEEPLTAAPSNGDEFVVIAGSHVHAIADIQSGLATSSGVTAAFSEIKGAGWSSATDTLEEIRDAVDAVPTAAENKTAVWNAATVDHTSTGSFGYVVGLFFQLIENVTGWRFTAKALEQVSGPDVYVYPMSMEQEPRNTHATITVYTEETGSQYFFAYDSAGTALSLTGKTLEFRVADTKSKQRLYTAKTSDGTLTISLGNKVTFTKSTKFTRFANTDVTYSLRDMDAGGEVLLDGQIELMWAP